MTLMSQDNHSDQTPAPEKGFFAFARRYSGIFALLGSSGMWGSLPLYWKLLDTVPALLIFYQRVVWSFVFLLLVILLMGRWQSVVSTVRNWRVLRVLILCSMLLAMNWLLYIWAVNNGLVIETSLGYYILPLLNVSAGVLLFGDKPSRAQYIAIALAFAGVAALVVMAGYVPWVALGLGGSFCVYGIVRKIAPVESLPGLFVETAILFIPSLAGVLYSAWSGFSFLDGAEPARDALLIGTGIATSVPLLFFAYGVRRVPLITVGVMQYISPTITFLLGVFVFGEPFSSAQGVAFACIWAALLLYSADSIRTHRHGGARKRP